jgi:hypothetical protein
MELSELVAEIQPANDEQQDYEVRVDTGDGEIMIRVSGVRWDHQERLVIIEMEE